MVAAADTTQTTAAASPISIVNCSNGDQYRATAQFIAAASPIFIVTVTATDIEQQPSLLLKLLQYPLSR